MIEWSLEDESLRVALFRFVDVLPSLDSSAEIGRHLEEYFARVDHALGGLALLAQTLHAGTLMAPVVRRNVVKLARRFIAEESGDHLIKTIAGLRKEPAAFTLDAVGEATVSDSEARAMQQRYLDLLRRLSAVTERWPTCGQIDASDNGNVPRVNLSVKLSSLCARFDPLDPSTEASVRRRLRGLLREALHVKAAITVDMEQYAFKELTLEIFQSVLAESEFRDGPNASIALQAYLRDSEKDVRELITWAREHGRRVGVRLVKGAYWDSEIAWAHQKGWPIPVYVEKAQTDASYERLSRMLLEARDVIDAAFGSHNLRSLAHAITTAKRLGIAANGYEIQMLYGMAEPVRRAIIANGQRVRVYLPVGELLPGISYLIRRLMENTSNTSFLRQTYADRKDINRLVQPPILTEAPSRRGSRPASKESGDRREFRNEPLSDFRDVKTANASASRCKKCARDSAVRQASGSTVKHSSHSIPPIGQKLSVECSSLRPATWKKLSIRRRVIFRAGARRRHRSGQKFFSRPPRSCGSGAGTSPHGKFSKWERAGVRRTQMLPRRSITSNIMGAKCCIWRCRAKRNRYRAKATSIYTSRAGSRQLSRRGIFRWRFLPG